MLMYTSHLCAGTVKYEEDTDWEKLNPDRLVECDPLLVPVLDPFVAVSDEKARFWAHTSPVQHCQVQCSLLLPDCLFYGWTQGLTEPFQAQYTKIQRNVVLTFIAGSMASGLAGYLLGRYVGKRR